MSGAGYPCVVEYLGGIRALLGHHLTPIWAKLCKEGLYHLVGIAKVVLIELLDVLLLNAVNDALYTNVGDGLLKVECLLKIIWVHLEAEEFVLGSVIFDGWIDCRWLNEAVGQGNGQACDSIVVKVIKSNANEPWSLPHAVVLMGTTICTICSIIRSMDLVIGYPTMVSSGFAAMMRLTVAWTDKPPAEE